MVVSFALHQGVRELFPVPVAAAGVRIEARGDTSFHHCGVVGIGDHRTFGTARVRGSDHAEERFPARDSVDDPGRVEDLVAAMLGIRLGKHGELDVGGIAADAAIVLVQIFDLVGGEREAEGRIGFLERCTPAHQDPDRGERLGLIVAKQSLGLTRRFEHRFGHAVVEELEHLPPIRVKRAVSGNVPRCTPLDAADRAEPAAVRDVGRLGRPGRNRSRTRHDEQHAPRGLRPDVAVL